MSARSVIAFLLLLNYLLVVGTGCMNRPEDQRERLMVRTTDDGQHYQQCRYLRMDGLETFLAEALASRYENAAETTQHHLMSVINGVDAHDLPHITWLLFARVHQSSELINRYLAVAPPAVCRAIDAPPW